MDESALNQAMQTGDLVYWYVKDTPRTDSAYTVVTLTTELKDQIKAASRRVQFINQQVKEKIAERYSVADEIKLLRKGKNAEFDEYNAYVEACVAEGQAKKAALGL